MADYLRRMALVQTQACIVVAAVAGVQQDQHLLEAAENFIRHRLPEQAAYAQQFFSSSFAELLHDGPGVYSTYNAFLAVDPVANSAVCWGDENYSGQCPSNVDWNFLVSESLPNSLDAGDSELVLPITRMSPMSQSVAKEGTGSEKLDDNLEKVTVKIDQATSKAAKLKEEVQEIESDLAALTKLRAELQHPSTGSGRNPS